MILAEVAQNTPSASFLMNEMQRSQIEEYIAYRAIEFPLAAKRLTAWLDEKVPRIKKESKNDQQPLKPAEVRIQSH
jgi:hypothetical protein